MNDPAPKLIVPRPVYATALIDESQRRAQALHAEMVANGTAEYAIPVPRHGQPYRTLTARKIGVWVHPCPSGQHAAHACYTCEETDEYVTALDGYLQRGLDEWRAQTAMAELPATLRGPAWTTAPTTAPTVRR
jgi:hypothetical protein